MGTASKNAPKITDIFSLEIVTSLGFIIAANVCICECFDIESFYTVVGMPQRLCVAYQQPKLIKNWLLVGLAALPAPHTNDGVKIVYKSLY